MRRAFTLVEALVAFCVAAIVLVTIFAIASNCRRYGSDYYDTVTTGVYRCVKTYTIDANKTVSSKLVDLEPQEGSRIITMRCDDDWRSGIKNSVSLYAQFESNKWYRVTSVGYWEENNGLGETFPLVKEVQKIEHEE